MDKECQMCKKIYTTKNKKQIVKIMGRIKIKKQIPIIQIGSTLQQNYGENIQKHGYGILNIETMEYQTKDLFNPRPFLSFKINSYDDIVDGVEKLVNS